MMMISSRLNLNRMYEPESAALHTCSQRTQRKETQATFTTIYTLLGCPIFPKMICFFFSNAPLSFGFYSKTRKKINFGYTDAIMPSTNAKDSLHELDFNRSVSVTAYEYAIV